MKSALEELLDESVKVTAISFGFKNRIDIQYIGTKEDTAQGKREEFIIRRYINE